MTELWDDRGVLGNLIRRDFASKYKNSFLGSLWSVLNPILLVLVYTAVFKYVFKIKPDINYPFAVFAFGGLVMWNVLSAGVTAGTGAIVGNAYLLQKVYIPREIFPLSMVSGTLITFVFEFTVLVIFQILFVPWSNFNYTYIYVPLMLMLALYLSTSLSLFFCTLTVRFRDVEHFVIVGVQAWMLLTPVMWDESQISGTFHRFLLNLNPAASIVDNFRRVMLQGQPPEWNWIIYTFVFSTVLGFLSWIYFNRVEPYFPELV